MNPFPLLGAILCAPVVLMTVLPAQGQAQDRGMTGSELRLELKKLSVLGSVLYIAAHPDDENTNLLAYLSKGRLARTAYLSVTRGEGGQNLIGREQGDALGVVRTEELLAARGIDGAEQFFTRAIDFGYSKTSEEAIRFWGEDEIVSDIVRVMRTFRPDVVITRFSPTIGGHGQHTASAILARKAFDLSGDPAYQPSPGGNLAPWKPVRLLFNGSTFMAPEFDTLSAMKVNAGGYNALLGESYNEISGRSRSMHKTQGFGASQNRGDAINYFQTTAGKPAASDILEGIDTAWSRVAGAEAAAKTLADAAEAFDPEHTSAILPLLLKAYGQLKSLGDDHWAVVKRRDLQRVILAAAGIRAEALASAGSASPGDSLRINASVINRSGHPFVLKNIRTAFARTDSAPGTPLANNRIVTVVFPVVVPPTEPATMPYWLERPATGARYDIPDPGLIGSPRRASPYRAIFTLGSPDGDIAFDVPVEFKSVDPVQGEQYRPFVIAPPMSIVPEEKVLLFPSSAGKPLTVRLIGGPSGGAGTLNVSVPGGWTVSPTDLPFRLRAGGGEERLTFTIKPGKDAAAGVFAVTADVGTGTVTTATTVIRYPHIPAQTIFPAATGKLVVADVKRKKFFIGYIEGSGDQVPEALRQAGYDVRLLSDEDLLSADLAPFQSIVAGVRAYNTRPSLAMARKRLTDYVEAGGTYVVQYSTSGQTDSLAIGPYPFRISRDRVSEETAPVTLLDPSNPALSYPNAIGEADFAGWVQERGLYYADSWDSAYAAPLAANDAGEPARRGGLLVARHGRGYFCYTGLSFFRQLPAGVPGAYRLFVNLVELGSREKTRGSR
jgi:LmbE family N-acetylglucosaminyl deacetylase